MSVSYKENELLLEKYKNGDESAADILVQNNLGLVKSIAARFTGRGQELEDLIQIGCIGMIKAIRGYDESFGTVFSTYAVPLITGEIKRFLRDDGLIKVSRTAKKNGYTLIKLREEFINQNQREPKLSELSQLSGLSYEDTLYALDATKPTMSLQEKITEDSNTEFMDTVCTQDDIESLCEKIALKQAMLTLSSDEQTLIKLRYFRCLTQSQTAGIMGITQVKVSRTEKKIIEKLKAQIS